VTDVLASTTDGSGSGPGLTGFLVLAFLALAVVFLYRSMRKQLKRIDFDPEGRTDAERMRRRGPSRNGHDEGKS
jgi:MYXO-CTERM domain-containing protein